MAEIGQSNFSLDPRPVVGGAGVAAPARAEVGIEGRGPVDTSRIPEYRPDHTGEANIEILAKIGGQLLAPAIKREQQARFDEGMRRAAAGEAAADIEAERPAWATFFGEGDVTLGARSYEGAADAANVEAEVIRQMPELRKLPSAQFQASLRTIVESKQTGDGTRDAALQRSFLNFMPQALKTHAKENWAWQQEEAVTQDLRYISATADTYELQDKASREAALAGLPVYPDSQSDRRTPIQSEGDKQAAKARLLSALVPAPGQNQKTRDNSVATVLFGQMSAGKMAFASTLRSTVDPATGQSLWDMLPPAHLDRLNAMYQSAGKTENFNRMSPADMNFITALSNTADPATLDAGIAKFNAEHKTRTGIDVDTLDTAFALRERARIVREAEQAEEKAKREGKVIADKVSKADVEAAQAREEVRRGVALLTNPSTAATGQLRRFVDLRMITKENALAAEEAAWASKPPIDPATGQPMADGKFKAMIVMQAVEPTGPMKQLVAQAFASPKMDGATQSMLSILEHLPQEKWQSQGMNSRQVLQASLYRNNVASGLPSAEAWEQAGQQALYAPQNNGVTNEADREALAAAHDEYLSNGWMFWKGDKLTSGGAATLSMIAANKYLSNGTFTDKKTAARNAMELAQAEMEVAGNTGWFRSNKDDPPAWSRVSNQADVYHPVTAGEFGAALTGVFGAKLKAAGLDVPPGDLVIVRAPDTKGKSLFFSAILYGETGKGTAVTADHKEIQDALNKLYKGSAEANRFPLPPPVKLF